MFEQLITASSPRLNYGKGDWARMYCIREKLMNMAGLVKRVHYAEVEDGKLTKLVVFQGLEPSTEEPGSELDVRDLVDSSMQIFFGGLAQIPGVRRIRVTPSLPGSLEPLSRIQLEFDKAVTDWSPIDRMVEMIVGWRIRDVWLRSITPHAAA